MRQRLAETLRFIVAQRLAPKIGGGRQLVMEIMGSNLRTREAILLGENEERSFYDITAASATYGWQTFDQSIIASYKEDKIDEETALAYASRKPVVMRAVDQHQHGLNQKPESSGLRMAHTSDDAPAPAPAPGGCAQADAVAPDGEILTGFSLFPPRLHRTMPQPMRIQVPTVGAPVAPLPNDQEDRIGRDDSSALVCCHEPSYLHFLTGQLRATGYKVHHATGHQAAVGRLAARTYDMTVLLENLEGCALVDNTLLRHLTLMPTDERRVTFAVMLCQSFATGDEYSAYAWSVECLINYQDIGQFAALTVPAVEEHNESNRFFTAAMRKAA